MVFISHFKKITLLYAHNSSLQSRDHSPCFFHRNESRSNFDTEEEYRAYIREKYGLDIALYQQEEEKRQVEKQREIEEPVAKKKPRELQP